MSLHAIALKKYGDSIIKEITGSGSILPGMLLERDYVGSASVVKAHSAEGQNCQPLFAIADALQGNDIDDAYATGALVRCEYFRPGDEVYAILEDGESVEPGDYLESNGAGYLQKHTADVHEDSAGMTGDFTAYTNQIVGVALEVLTLSGDSSAESSASPLALQRRLKIEIV